MKNTSIERETFFRYVEKVLKMFKRGNLQVTFITNSCLLFKNCLRGNIINFKLVVRRSLKKNRLFRRSNHNMLN